MAGGRSSHGAGTPGIWERAGAGVADDARWTSASMATAEAHRAGAFIVPDRRCRAPTETIRRGQERTTAGAFGPAVGVSRVDAHVPPTPVLHVPPFMARSFALPRAGGKPAPRWATRTNVLTRLVAS